MQTFKTSKARENILSRIRKSLGQDKLPMPFPEAEKEAGTQLYAGDGTSLEETFADAFIQLGGKFIFCHNEQQALEAIGDLYDSRGWTELYCAEPRLLQLFQNNKINIVHPVDIHNDKANACITGCEFLAARTGSVLLSSKQNMGRTSTVFYPVHIIVAYTDQVVPDIQNAMDALKKKYGNDLPSMINLNTGPSRTADIEKTLVVGVHGPGEVFCLLVNA
ncbi:MAG: LUD domain-containing protein [Bacteroidetes bacterium]|nr:LUD domain-containing protein [Bacteroidota bacterium]